jgi:hypothetical protein
LDRRIEEDKEHDDAGDGARSAQDQGRLLFPKRVPDQPDQSGSDNRRQINPQELRFSIPSLDRSAQHPQTEHIPEQVEDIRRVVSKSVGQKAPPHPGLKQIPGVKRQEVGQAVIATGKNRVGGEGNDIDDDDLRNCRSTIPRWSKSTGDRFRVVRAIVYPHEASATSE